MNTKFKLKNENMDLSQDLICAAHNDELLARILINRGIDTAEKIRSFIDLKYYKPLQVEDIPELNDAVKIICDAITRKHKIAIYGDYDVDGVTATTILIECLRNFTDNITYHVPDRFTEGYGINIETVKSLARDNVKLIISCDCGISNMEEIKTAKQLGINVVVTDHHTLPQNIPPADLILNPKFLDYKHPAYNLSGCGVAYFLCRAILKHYEREEDAAKFLDLVALSIIADSVPLIGENRYLLKMGMPNVINSSRIGLSALYKTIRDNGRICEDDIAFQVAPRINAAGRLDSARLPVELLLCDNKQIAAILADKINNLNIIRKDIQQRIVDESIEIVETQKMHKNIIILYSDSWHQGVIGIAAGKIAEKCKKPVILLCPKQDTDIIIGSGRSTQNINIYELIKSCSMYLNKFGGHPMAAGLSLQKDNLDRFIFKIEDAAIKLFPGEQNIDCYADAYLQLSQINKDTYSRISLLAPYGEGFEPPIFVSRGIKVINDRITDKGHHFLVLSDYNNYTVPAVKWSGGHNSYKDSIYDIAYNIYSSPDNATEHGYTLKISVNNMTELEHSSKTDSELFKTNIIDARLHTIDSILKSHPKAEIFFEGIGSHNLSYKTQTRDTLHNTETLVLLSVPVNIEIFKEIISIAKPQNLLVNFTKSMDYTFKNFISNTLGVIKHILNKKNGMASMQYLEQLLCAEENILKTSFTYLRNYGKIEFEIDYQSNIVFFQKPNYNPGAANIQQIENQLKNALQDKNAYIRYMQNIDIDKLYALITQ